MSGSGSWDRPLGLWVKAPYNESLIIGAGLGSQDLGEGENSQSPGLRSGVGEPFGKDPTRRGKTKADGEKWQGPGAGAD